MKLTKYLLILSALLCYLVPSNAQYTIHVEPNNTSEVVHYLYELYGDQILIEAEEVQAILEEIINPSNYDENCEMSPVEIAEYEPDFLTFDWDDSQGGVEYYEHRALNLYDGNLDYTSTFESMATYAYNTGFYLFMFNGVCAENRVSQMQIIIVDKDVMINGHPILRNCNCEDPSISYLSMLPGPPTTGSSSGSFVYGHSTFAWPSFSTCVFNKYIVDIRDASSGYSASAFVIHRPGVSPQLIYLHPMCSENMTVPPPPYLNPGDPGNYFLSFTTSQIIVNIQDWDLSQNADISVKSCQCTSSGREATNIESASISDLLKISYQNPVENQMNLRMNLPEAGSVSYQFLDITGKPISSALQLNGLKGANDFLLPTDHLQAGIFSLIINYNGTEETLRVVKVN